MKITRRSFSLGQNNRARNPHKLLHSSLPRPNITPTAIPKLSNTKGWGNNIYRYQKSLVIKQIINDYFKQELQEQKMLSPVHVSSRRPNRFQHRQHSTLREPPKLGQDLVSANSVEIETSASKTAYSLSWHRFKLNQLPPINQQGEQPESEECQLRSTFFSGSYAESNMLRSSSAFSDFFNPEPSGPEQTYLPAFQNQLFKVMIVMKAGKPIARLKQFKQAGLPVLDRQNKINSFGLPSIWKESTRGHSTIQTGMQLPLKSQICKISRDAVNPLNFIIRPKALFKRLAADGFRQFRSLLRSFCQDLKKVEGKVINNKLNPDNMFLTKQYKLCLAQWGYSSFRDAYDIQSNSYESRRAPVLKGQNSWFVSPQYLAPEVISQLLGQNSVDIWTSASSPDIWSLGLFSYEVMTLVPIWSSFRCSVPARSGQFSTIRNGQKAGILGVAGRDLRKIQQRQKTLQSLIRKDIQSWSEETKQLGHLILQMVEPRREMRITLDGLITAL